MLSQLLCLIGLQVEGTSFRTWHDAGTTAEGMSGSELAILLGLGCDECGIDKLVSLAALLGAVGFLQ